MTYVIFTQPNCTYCEEAKQLLYHRNLGFITKDIMKEENREQFNVLFPGARSVPQIGHRDERGWYPIGTLSNLKKHLGIE